MNKAMLAANLPPVDFSFDDYAFVVTMLDNEIYARQLEQKKNGGLNSVLSELRLFIEYNPGLQIRELSEKIGKSSSTLEKQIKKLVDGNLVERRGSKKTGGYWTK